MLHSTILELFDYLTKEPIKKLASHIIQQYSDDLLKAPKYEYYFRSFLIAYDDKAIKSSGISRPGYKIGQATQSAFSDFYHKQQRDSMKKQDEDLIKFGERSTIFKGGIDEDEKYNQEMFLKRKQEQERSGSQNLYPSIYPSMMKKRKNSNDYSSSDDDNIDEVGDMGLYGEQRKKFQKL